jgi:hypothetical protein
MRFQEHMRPWIESSPGMTPREDLDGKEVVEKAKGKGGRPGWDWEIAGVVAMLCLKDSAWCTGSVVCANGGMRMGC